MLHSVLAMKHAKHVRTRRNSSEGLPASSFDHLQHAKLEGEGVSYHMVHGTGFTCRHVSCVNDVAFCTSYQDETSVQNMSELEGIALKSCQMTREIPPVTKCS